MPDDSPSNGWRTGKDPVQRWLGIVVALVCLAVFTYLAVDPDRGMDALTVGGVAMGTVLILLGYGKYIVLPGIGRKRDDG